MRRFNYEDGGDHRNEVDSFFDERNNDDYNMMLNEVESLEKQIDLAYRDLNYRILRAAVKTCENTFLWKFFPHVTKLDLIKKTYQAFRELEEERYLDDIEDDSNESED